jgi:lipopolysaccharide/colanic/teichoic acid biosynthesis glycosyltransferase
MECAGFQYIPFRPLRFRTTRADRPAEPTAVGALIRRLRLANLPQLINVVRGDMALVGPKPVRLEFARYLSRLMPFHAHRFAVKPGITGLAQMRVRGSDVMPEELGQIEYDLYYVKEGSLWMDIAIMLQSLRPGASSTIKSAPRIAAQGAD